MGSSHGRRQHHRPGREAEEAGRQTQKSLSLAFDADPEDDDEPQRIIGLPRPDDEPAPTHAMGSVAPAE
jgi:hypothetical protein